ncbi:hypothetical protein N431DRAFT_467904 [Stipitochalara longipes BDJ]|nr:hypothetical protein N431DRAFT_467904 [Stipitochalara longipes BDJ]
MSSSVFSETLQAITTTKLRELSKKRSIFEKSKAALISTAKLERDQQERLRILVDGVKLCFAIKTAARRGSSRRIVSGSCNDPDLEVMLMNLERFLEQARFDPTVSPKLLGDWENSLLKKLDIQSLKFQYATLYGELVNEWLRAEKVVPADNASDISEGFEKINRAERDESRANWEKLVFEPFETDPMAISEYLQTLFGLKSGNRQSVKALKALRKSVADFEISLSTPGQFNDQVLRWTINGLMGSGLLSDEKRAVLKDFLASPVILAEVADVLNMRIAAISTWSWEGEVPVEQRRHVTGAYHVYIDEELLQAIFLQFIGVKWSVFFKEAFTNFSNFEGAWASLRTPLSKNDIGVKRREYFLGHQRKKPSVQGKRQEVYKSIFFMSQLPNSPFDGATAVEGEEEAEYARPAKRGRSKQTARKTTQFADVDMDYAMQDFDFSNQSIMPQHAGMQQQPQAMMQQIQPMQMPQAPQATGFNPYLPKARTHQSILLPFHSDEYDTVPASQKTMSKMETKQYLLHLISTELLINTRLHGDFTCSRSEFYSWSPSLPHSTITSVLTFFGLSEKWLGFFRTFLEAPLKFTEDGTSAETRLRKRGVPGAHALSSVCGETILFCMDYAVNQATNGTNLYRMNDDFWVFDKNHDTVVKAWAAITKFSDTMGVSLNNGKTGTVRILREPSSPSTGNPFRPSASTSKHSVPAPIDPSLPTGSIRWGFLIMDPLSGQFVIDQDQVSTHITSLQTQLSSKSSSIFSYIQAWNTYAGTFFSSNFGKPANCFGRQHVDEMLSTFTRIQEIIFPASNVVQHLKQEIEQRFGITDIPDGYLYFPTSLGGLDLQNPFIGLIQVRDDVFESPSAILSDFLDSEREAYRLANIAFNSGLVYRHSNGDANFVPHDGNVFFSFEEFSRYREEFACDYKGNLLSVWTDLMERPRKEGIEVTGDEELGIDDLVRAWVGGDNEGKKADGEYLKWVVKLFGEEMKERFGGYNVVEKGLLPMGMVGLFRSGRVKWQG